MLNEEIKEQGPNKLFNPKDAIPKEEKFDPADALTETPDGMILDNPEDVCPDYLKRSPRLVKKQTRHQEREEWIQFHDNILIFVKTPIGTMLFNSKGRRFDSNALLFNSAAKLLSEYISLNLRDQLKHLRHKSGDRINGLVFFNRKTKAKQSRYSKNCDILINDSWPWPYYERMIYRLGFRLRPIFDFKYMSCYEIVND